MNIKTVVSLLLIFYLWNIVDMKIEVFKRHVDNYYQNNR